MDDNLETLLAALRDHGCAVVERGGPAMAQCPAHADRTPSLAIRYDEDEGKILMHDFAGCDNAQILESLGLGWEVMFGESSPVRNPEPKFKPTYGHNNGFGMTLGEAIEK